MNVFLWNARARNGHVEATLNHPFPAQVKCLDSPSGTRTLKVKVFDALDHGKVRGLADAVVELARLAYGLHRPDFRTTAARNCIKNYEADTYAVLGLAQHAA